MQPDRAKTQRDRGRERREKREREPQKKEDQRRKDSRESNSNGAKSSESYKVQLLQPMRASFVQLLFWDRLPRELISQLGCGSPHARLDLDGGCILRWWVVANFGLIAFVLPISKCSHLLWAALQQLRKCRSHATPGVRSDLLRVVQQDRHLALHGLLDLQDGPRPTLIGEAQPGHSLPCRRQSSMGLQDFFGTTKPETPNPKPTIKVGFKLRNPKP